MNCPICQIELEYYNDTTYEQCQTIKCPRPQNDKHNNTHYCKYATSDWTHFDEIEEISLYPFRIKNMFQTFHAHTMLTKDGEPVERIPERKVNSCYIYKFNQDKFKHLKNYGGGFDQILKLPYYIKPELENKLRERIKLLLLLS